MSNITIIMNFSGCYFNANTKYSNKHLNKGNTNYRIGRVYRIRRVQFGGIQHCTYQNGDGCVHGIDADDIVNLV